MTNVITRLSTVGSPGLVVMVDNSRSKGRGFESQCHILDGDFSHWFVVKNCIVCLKRPKINEKEARVGPFFLKKVLSLVACLMKQNVILGRNLLYDCESFITLASDRFQFFFSDFEWHFCLLGRTCLVNSKWKNSSRGLFYKCTLFRKIKPFWQIQNISANVR